MFLVHLRRISGRNSKPIIRPLSPSRSSTRIILPSTWSVSGNDCVRQLDDLIDQAGIDSRLVSLLPTNRDKPWLLYTTIEVARAVTSQNKFVLDATWTASSTQDARPRSSIHVLAKNLFALLLLVKNVDRDVQWLLHTYTSLLRVYKKQHERQSE